MRQAELGEVVAPGTPVVTLADLDHVWLRAYVNEPIWAAFTGARRSPSPPTPIPASSTTGAFRSSLPTRSSRPRACRPFEERVTLVYRIKIDIDNPNHELKPGMPADAHIQLAAQHARSRTQ